MKYVFLIFIIILSSGCVVKYKDDSKNERYSKIIDKQFKIIKPLPIMANLLYSKNSNKKNAIYSYTITPPPGYAGRYVSWGKLLKSNTIFTIKKILDYDDLLLDDYSIFINIDNNELIRNDLPIKTGLQLPPPDKNGIYTSFDTDKIDFYKKNASIQIRSSLTILSKDGKYIIMDPEYFEEVK
ncbi:MAG: hypothetical protein KAQ94_05890 [Arcobacteraceae bacterium]|nr:hypothetical protein [Arcobacteraceae bacterium]